MFSKVVHFSFLVTCSEDRQMPITQHQFVQTCSHIVTSNLTTKNSTRSCNENLKKEGHSSPQPFISQFSICIHVYIFFSRIQPSNNNKKKFFQIFFKSLKKPRQVKLFVHIERFIILRFLSRRSYLSKTLVHQKIVTP